MKFYATSDLHLDIHGIRRDFWKDFDQDAVLIIAGDISNSLSEMKYVENVLCKHFKSVIFVAGNHEWYSHRNISYKKNIQTFRKESQSNPRVIKNPPLPRLKAHSERIDNLFFLNNECLKLDGCTIFGGTLWFPIHTFSEELVSQYSKLMNDTKFINHKIIEEQYKAFINNCPEHVDLVISHHLPNAEAFARVEDASNEYAPFYHANLDNEFIARARFWISGLQHESVEKTGRWKNSVY
ncbi:metallophosphoesterase [Vibrio furnissii]|uniref:metallophosphoesterase n=1 Tax=Vibrio furnissii TaxID=29494 RepID=UPI0030B961E8